MKKNFKPKKIIIDIDGVMTSGHMIYTSKGIVGKIFGPDDHDALKLLEKYCSIEFISSDKIGFSISKKRIDSMNFKISHVPTHRKENWFKKNNYLKNTIYMGDGFFDHNIFKIVGFSITFKDSLQHVKKNANLVINRSGSNRAVAEACIYILNKFFKVKEIK